MRNFSVLSTTILIKRMLRISNPIVAQHKRVLSHYYLIIRSIGLLVIRAIGLLVR